VDEGQPTIRQAQQVTGFREDQPVAGGQNEGRRGRLAWTCVISIIAASPGWQTRPSPDV
jgi:hypothetical protein